MWVRGGLLWDEAVRPGVVEGFSRGTFVKCGGSAGKQIPCGNDNKKGKRIARYHARYHHPAALRASRVGHPGSWRFISMEGRRGGGWRCVRGGRRRRGERGRSSAGRRRGCR